jgi:hypothetical protein
VPVVIGIAAPVFTVQVDDRRVLLHFAKLPMALRSNLRPVITRLTSELLGQVRAAEPTRTGQLRSLTRAFVDDSENFVRGRVRVLGGPGQPHNIAAAALEYGAHRQFEVRAYRRDAIAVSAYQRRANIAAVRFLRGPAERMREHALAELEAAVTKSIAEVNAP